MRDVSKYQVDGRRVPSVTEILERAGFTDFSMVPPDVLEYARLRGTEVHEWLELLDAGYLHEDDEPSEWIRGYVHAYLAFKRESGFAPLRIEEPVVSATYLYAGMLDRTGMLNGREVLLDLKAVNRLDRATALQTMGYAMAVSDEIPRYALQLRPDGKYRLERYRDDFNDRHVFLSAVRVVHWQLANGVTHL